MTKQKIEFSESESSGPGRPESSVDAVRDRLAGLLSEDALQDALDGLRPEEITGPGGLVTQLAGRVLETALGAELTEHLGYPPGQAPPGGAGNHRNGHTPKTVRTELGPVEVRTPRDRAGTFEPRLVEKRQTRLAGLDERVLDLYAGGMTVRDIESHLRGLYGVEIGRDTISRVTDAVLEDVAAWRSRPLEPVYPIVYFDALHVKVREDRSVRTRACYLAVGVTVEGDREALGIWWQDSEGSKFWLAVLNDLHQRGVKDVLIACVDGLAGFPEAIEAVFPKAWVQTCIVHQIRSSLRYVPYKDRRKGRGRPQADLHRPQRRGRRDRARALRRELGGALPDDRPSLAARLGAHHAVPRTARRAASRCLHDQHDRGHAPPDPQGDQDPRPLPRRTGRHQAHLPRHRTSRNEMEVRTFLDTRTHSPQDPLRRPTARLKMNPVASPSHTEARTPSSSTPRSQ
jgi:hypothetical protein